MRLDVSARGCSCVKAYSHWEVGAWEDGAARGDVTVWVCARRSAIVRQQAYTRPSPQLLSPSRTRGFMSEIIQASVTFSSLFVSSPPGTCTNDLCKARAVSPCTLTPSDHRYRQGREHGSAARAGVQLVLLPAVSPRGSGG